MYLLDSSAWLVHLFGETGLEEVNALFDDDDTVVCISVLSLVEVYARLKAIGREAAWPAVFGDYQMLFTRILPIDEGIAEQAILLRAGTTRRLPTVDALIAATASVEGLTLVHRDPHMSAIGKAFLQQLVLPQN